MTKNKESTRYYSERQEQQIVKVLGGRQTTNSGAGRWEKSDILIGNVLIEAKTLMTPQISHSIKKVWLETLKENAFAVNKNGVLAFNFGPDEENFYIINEDLMKRLLELLNRED